MGHFGKKDPKLTEVKAVLQRLQGFTEEDDPAGMQPADGSAQAAGKAGRPRTNGAVSGTMIFALAAGVLATVLLVAFLQSSSPPVETAKPQEVKAALAVARNLMAEGKVRAARQRLLTLAEQGSPDAAWDVARSYDPNVLATIPMADADPDIAEAEHWYRAWYGAAVKAGLISKGVPLQRIIDSMRK